MPRITVTQETYDLFQDYARQRGERVGDVVLAGVQTLAEIPAIRDELAAQRTSLIASLRRLDDDLEKAETLRSSYRRLLVDIKALTDAANVEVPEEITYALRILEEQAAGRHADPADGTFWARVLDPVV